MHISLAAEKLFSIGPFPVTNTLLTSWIVIILLVVLGFLATRKMREVPKGIQNFFEAIIESLLNLIENVTADRKQAIKFLPLVVTIFLFIITANWMGLLPGVGTIGFYEEETEVHAEEASGERLDETGHGEIESIASSEESAAGHENIINEAADLTIEEEPALAETTSEDHLIETSTETASEAEDQDPVAEHTEKVITNEIIDPTIVGSGDEEDEIPTYAATTESETNQKVEYEEVIVPSEEVVEVTVEETATGEVEEHEAAFVPIFRAANSDLNVTLALAIISVFAAQIFGIGALGFFKYSKKFFNFTNPINFFVGILELIGEISKMISFSFRLFGNIFAGEVLLVVIAVLVPFIAPLPFYFLEIFVGFIQALVFAMLTLVFLKMAVTSHEEH